MSDTSFDTELNPARDFVGQEQGMKNVLYGPTNTVGAFPINTSDQDIQSAFEQYNSQRPQEDVNPNLYNAVVKPALDQAKVTGNNTVVYAANKRLNEVDPFNNFLSAGATFGLAQNKDIEAQGEAELHPAEATAGNLVGQMGSILATAGVSGALGMEKVAQNLGLVARGATPLAVRTAIAGSGDVLEDQTVGKAIQGTVQSVSSNAMLGMVYNGISEAARQGKAMFDDSEGNIKQQAPDLVKLGEKTLSGLGWGPWGVGAPFAAKSIAGLMNGSAAVFSTAYLLSKASGMDEPDAVLNGTLGAALHFAGGANHTQEQTKNIIDSTQNAIADYVKAKNQASGVGNVNELVAKELMNNEIQNVVNESDKNTMALPEPKGSWINDQFIPEQESQEPTGGPGAILSKSADDMEAFNTQQKELAAQHRLPGTFNDGHSPYLMDYLSKYLSPHTIVRLDPIDRISLGNSPVKDLEGYAANEREIAQGDAQGNPKIEQDAALARGVPRDPVEEVTNSPTLMNNLMKNLVDKVAPEGEQTLSRAEATPAKEGTDGESLGNSKEENAGEAKEVVRASSEKTSSQTGDKLAGQEPVTSEGEEKNSRLSERVTSALDNEKSNNPTYNELNTKDAAQKAIDLQKSDPELVARVNAGIEPAPEGYSETALRFAHREALKEAGKNDEAASSLNAASLRGTRLGQEVNLYKLYKDGTEHDPNDFIKKAIQDRIKSVNKNRAKTFKQIDSQKSDIRNKLDNATIDPDEIQKVIDSIIC